MEQQKFSGLQKISAWAVHVFTASGIASAFLALLAIHNAAWREAMLWLVLCLLIDGIDGTFARLARVQEVLPNISGKNMDTVIDFTTYAFIPAYFFHQAIDVPEPLRLPLTFLMLIVSVVYYGKEGMVSSDYYFIGFPVLWNMVVFYQFFIWDFAPEVQAGVIVFFAILHFIPIKFAYPSRNARWKIASGIATLFFFVMLVGTLWSYPEQSHWWIWLGNITALYYAIAAIWETWFRS